MCIATLAYDTEPHANRTHREQQWHARSRNDRKSVKAVKGYLYCPCQDQTDLHEIPYHLMNTTTSQMASK